MNNTIENARQALSNILYKNRHEDIQMFTFENTNASSLKVVLKDNWQYMNDEIIIFSTGDNSYGISSPDFDEPQVVSADNLESYLDELIYG